MAEDQKERYIQYLAEQNQDLRLTSDAMKLVLEDFMAQMKDLKAQVSSMESKHADLENRLSEEHKLRKSAERKIKSLQERLDYAHQERFGDRRQKIKSKAKTGDSDRHGCVAQLGAAAALPRPRSARGAGGGCPHSP